MPKETLRINGIEGGISFTQFGPEQEDSYDGAFGIDPDFRTNVNTKAGGAITPTAYTKFSSSELDSSASVNWLTTTPKDSSAYLYAYASNGDFLRYTYSGTAFGTETALTTPTSGAGNGMAYYNNYIYLATPTNIARYGPLDNSPTLTQTWWTSASCLNNAQYVLSNKTYPSFQGGATLVTPNHAMHVHTDGFLYICDVISTSYTDDTTKIGKGVIHRIGTDRTTDEGDTNNGSAYDVLELPFGYYPVAIESWGTDLAIIAMPGTGLSTLTLQRGSAVLFLWDTFSAIPYKQITLPDPVATAIKNVNGRLFIWSGNTASGVRITTFNGGEGVDQLALISESMSPYQGGVDSFGDKAFFGGYTTYPGGSQLACVYSIDSKISQLPHYAIHVPAFNNEGGTAPVSTAIKMTLMNNMVRPTPTFASAGSSASGIYGFTTGSTQFAQFRKKWEIGRPFSVRSVRLSLDRAVSSGVSITPTLVVDNGNDSQALTSITNTDFSGNRTIAFKRPEIALTGQENLSLNLEFVGTVAASVIFPVEVDIDVFDVIKTG